MATLRQITAHQQVYRGILREQLARHGDAQGVVFARQKVKANVMALPPLDRAQLIPAFMLAEFEELRGPVVWV
ncbi:MAG: hypothetical protein CME59_15525 [Halioglobus sp.]|nr:hypothetical protein [Halioglobus sp.]|tara:strand:- start:70 stop:288 length:219 start_codon:yes stop_codon:yes gene_type:complete